MPTSNPDILAASAIAEEVLDQALKYVDRVYHDGRAERYHADALLAQHVKIQLACLQDDWTVEERGKTIDALETMGHGLRDLGAASGKHSLHVKLVQS
jgi:hypothetical protein